MNDDHTNEEIELPSREEPKRKKKYPKKKKNREVVQQQIDLTVDEDIREIEEFKQDEQQYDQYDQYDQQDKYAQYDQYGNYDDELQHHYKQEDDEQYDELLHMSETEYPPIPTRSIVFTLVFLIVGIGLILAGVFSYVNHEGTTKIILFVLFGIALVTPGFIYGLILIQAISAGTPEEKREILNQIPV